MLDHFTVFQVYLLWTDGNLILGRKEEKTDRQTVEQIDTHLDRQSEPEQAAQEKTKNQTGHIVANRRCGLTNLSAKNFDFFRYSDSHSYLIENVLVGIAQVEKLLIVEKGNLDIFYVAIKIYCDLYYPRNKRHVIESLARHRG